MIKIAFQGTNGAYSEEALRKYFGEKGQALGLKHSEEVTKAVLKKEVEMGILPVENSIIGNVTVNLDLLFNDHLYVVGEVYLPIHHCLLVKAGTKLEDVKFARSHPVALQQCSNFLQQNNIKPIPAYDTAGSSKDLSLSRNNNEAAISSKLCSSYYDLEILNDDIQNNKNNTTRFLIFTIKNNIPTDIKREKTSIAFTLGNQSGALLKCLQVFAKHNINLTKIESRPNPENPFSYNFFVDFIGDTHELEVKTSLVELKRFTSFIKILGSYCAGK